MQRHLVIQLARFGDLVQTKRLLASLAAGGPSGGEGPELHLCLDRSLAPLAGLLYPEAILHPVVAHRAGPDPGPAGLLAANREAFGRLRSIRFDRVWNLNFSGLNLGLASLFEPDTVRGYRTVSGQPHIDAWPAMAMRWTRRRRTWGLNLVDLWAAYADRMVPPDRVNPAAAPKGGGLGVVLAGRHSRRCLPPEVLAPLVAAAARGGRITLLGSESERPFARALLRELKPAVLGQVEDLSGRTGWRELIEVVSGLDAVLTPDTGTMHLAAHLGVPVQALFLSSAWCFETGPYAPGHTVWQAARTCAPCLESQPCGHGLACLSPFAAPAFVRAFGRSFLDNGQEDGTAACPGVVGYRSGLDGLGATYAPFSLDPADRAAEQADRAERTAFRSFVAAYLGLDGETPGEPVPPAADLAGRLLQERDWMLGRGEAPAPACPAAPSSSSISATSATSQG